MCLASPWQLSHGLFTCLAHPPRLRFSSIDTKGRRILSVWGINYFRWHSITSPHIFEFQMKSEVWGNGREFEEDGAGLEGTGEEVDDKEAEGNNWLRVRPLSLYLKTQKDHSLLDCPVGIRRWADGRKRQRKGIREKKKNPCPGYPRKSERPQIPKPWESRWELWAQGHRYPKAAEAGFKSQPYPYYPCDLSGPQ